MHILFTTVPKYHDFSVTTEAVARRCSIKKVVLEISLNSQENTCARTTLLKKSLWYRCFPVNCAKFLRTPFFTEHLWWLLLLLERFTDLSVQRYVNTDNIKKMFARSQFIHSSLKLFSHFLKNCFICFNKSPFLFILKALFVHLKSSFRFA